MSVSECEVGLGEWVLVKRTDGARDRSESCATAGCLGASKELESHYLSFGRLTEVLVW
jgi:hypothetical protein